MVRLSFYAIAFGLAAALLAVPTGLLDWSGIKKEKPAWKIGLYHMALNLLVALLFAINLALRWPTFREATVVNKTQLLLSAIGTLTKNAELTIMRTLNRATGRPVLLGEYHMGATDRGITSHGLVGHRVPGLPPMLLLEHTGAKSGA